MIKWIKKIIDKAVYGVLYLDPAWEVKPKRARSKGRYRADDKSTPNYNEAWVGGKAPKKKKKTKKKKKKASKKKDGYGKWEGNL